MRTDAPCAAPRSILRLMEPPPVSPSNPIARRTWHPARGTLLLGLCTVLIGCSGEDNSIVVIALHPTKARIIYVATNQAVYKTRDHGTTWTKFPGFSARRVTTLAIDPKSPATIYAGTMGDAVYKSPDGGQRWLPHNVGLKEHISYVTEFVIDPIDTQTIYAASTVGVYRTRNGAREWQEKMVGMKEVHIVVAIALDPKNPNILYAGTTGGVYRSSDAALTWKKVNSGLIPEYILQAAMALGVNILVVDPLRSGTVYAGTINGLFKTTNDATTWFRIGESLPDQFISTIAIDPTDSQILYVGGREGVYKSEDGGEAWQPVNDGFETSNIRTIVMSPHDPKTLYAGTNGSGLYRTSNGGRQWTRIPLWAEKDRPASSPL